VVSLLVGTGAAFAAQTTGQIQGLVTDKQGKPLENVTVTLVGPTTSGRPTTSDEHGEFRFFHLNPGTYSVWADEDGPRVAWRSVGVRVGVTSHVTLIVRTPEGDECDPDDPDPDGCEEVAPPAPAGSPKGNSPAAL
jgi:hypothetical protein